MGGTGRKLRLGPSYNGSKVSVKSSNLNSFPSKSQTSTHAPGSSIKNSKSKKSNSVKQNLTPVHPHNDCLWIGREIKSVYKPHALPKEINNLSFRIKYSDGVELRKICDFIRLNQWTSICEKKVSHSRFSIISYPLILPLFPQLQAPVSGESLGENAS